MSVLRRCEGLLSKGQACVLGGDVAGTQRAVAELQVAVDQLEREAVTRGQVPRSTVSKLASELRSLRQSLSQMHARQGAASPMQHHVGGAAGTGVGWPPQIPNEGAQRRQNEDTKIQMGNAGYTYATENDRLNEASAQIDGFLQQGAATMEELKRQRSMLDRARQRVLSVAEGLGMSDKVITTIQKRGFEDKILFFCGALITLLFMYITSQYLL